MTVRVIIMAGGTGGHVFPALAVADELRNRGAKVSWLGTKRGLESSIVPKAGIKIDWVTISGLRGNGLMGWIKAPFRLMSAMYQAWEVFYLRKPNVVLGMGGFVAGPGGLIAWLMRKPLVVHEQNSIPGMTNRFLAKLAKKVLVAFPDAFKDRKGVLDIGNPLREDMLRIDPPDLRLKNNSGPMKLLIIGGSLGAVALNQVVPRAIKQLVGTPIEVWHQTGKKNLNETLAFYQQEGVEGRVVPFIDDMSQAYAWADLVVCRAGALTISELAAIGVASILVPFPHAVDDHQTTNAKYLVDKKAAICIQQSDLNANELAKILSDFNINRDKLLAMAIAARQLSRPDATRRVADLCMEVARV